MSDADLPSADDLWSALLEEQQLARILEEKYSSSWESLRELAMLERGEPQRYGWQLTLDLTPVKPALRLDRFGR